MTILKEMEKVNKELKRHKRIGDKAQLAGLVFYLLPRKVRRMESE